jgi:hypothetical protein
LLHQRLTLARASGARHARRHVKRCGGETLGGLRRHFVSVCERRAESGAQRPVRTVLGLARMIGFRSGHTGPFHWMGHWVEEPDRFYRPRRRLNWTILLFLFFLFSFILLFFLVFSFGKNRLNFGHGIRRAKGGIRWRRY